jgi:hypothetical protein
MNIHRIFAFLLATFIVAVQAKAQHEISAYGMGGYSSLLYKATDVNVSSGFGGGFGIGYTYLLEDNWGISAGLEMLFVGAQAEAQQLSGSFKTTAPEPSGTFVDMQLNSTYTGYKESHSATYLHIPLAGQWHTDGFGDYLDFYARAGVKLGFGISGSYKLTADKLVTTGDIPAWLITLPNNPNHNFVTKANIDYTGELSFGFSLALAAEGGVKWQLADQWSLYTGVYVDYGVLNVAPSTSGALVQVPVDSPAAFTYNSLLTSSNGGSRYADKVNWLSAGVRMRIAFGL